MLFPYQAGCNSRVHWIHPFVFFSSSHHILSSSGQFLYLWNEKPRPCAVESVAYVCSVCESPNQLLKWKGSFSHWRLWFMNLWWGMCHVWPEACEEALPTSWPGGGRQKTVQKLGALEDTHPMTPPGLSQWFGISQERHAETEPWTHRLKSQITAQC